MFRLKGHSVYSEIMYKYTNKFFLNVNLEQNKNVFLVGLGSICYVTTVFLKKCPFKQYSNLFKKFTKYVKQYCGSSKIAKLP